MLTATAYVSRMIFAVGLMCVCQTDQGYHGVGQRKVKVLQLFHVAQQSCLRMVPAHMYTYSTVHIIVQLVKNCVSI